uniref:uncharacterized protein LOC122580437 n=1 Tax=Erigeron canadensis TaxID=72917 RepID=UPI001CB8C725|nr:uncharacterized protein LOC122580437 [Erigeron canadensis]
MKAFGLWVLLLVFGTALMICLCSPSFPRHEEASIKLNVHKCRKLKENMNADPYEGNASNIDLLDYHKIDPVPSSKAAIKHGPVQHDVPLMPYIPKPPSPEPNDPDDGDVFHP